jgi:chaperonin cofactor prefoldin
MTVRNNADTAARVPSRAKLKANDEDARRAALARAKAQAEAAARRTAEALKKKVSDAVGLTSGFKAASKAPVALGGKPNAPTTSTAGNSIPAKDLTLANAAVSSPSVKPLGSVGAKKPEDLTKYFPDLKGADKATLKKVWDAMNDVATGSPAAKLKGLATLAKQFPTTINNVLDKLGVKDAKLAKLATNSDVLTALSTLTDPAKSAADKFKAAQSLAKSVGKTFTTDDLKDVLGKLGLKDAELARLKKFAELAKLPQLAKLATDSAALDALLTLTDPAKSPANKAKAVLSLAKSVGDSFKPEELKGVLQTALKGLPAAEKLVDAVATWADRSKSGLEKAKATFDLARALKDFTGDAFPKLANGLRTLDGPLKAVGATLTLLDPAASIGDKALAAAQLAAEIPDLKKNLAAFKELLSKAGVKNAEQVAEEAAKAAKVAVKGLNPKLVASLTEAGTRQLSELATRVGPDKLEQVLKGITDKEALTALTGQLSKLDDAAARRLLDTLSGLEHGVLQKALKNPELAESLGKLASRLDDDGARFIGKLVKDFDEAGLKALTKFTGELGHDALKNALKVLGPIADKGGSKVAGQALKVLDSVLVKMGVKVTGEVAEKVLKNLVKAVPLAGAVPNLIDAAKYGKEAAKELRGKNKDLGMFAANMAKLNVLDGAVGVLMDATGVGLVADVATSVAFSAVELAGDIAFEAEKRKMLADPKNYQAPDWMKAVNLAVAAAQGPAGAIELAAYYGPEGAAQLTRWGIEKGAKGAIELARSLFRIRARP